MLDVIVTMTLISSSPGDIGGPAASATID